MKDEPLNQPLSLFYCPKCKANGSGHFIIEIRPSTRRGRICGDEVFPGVGDISNSTAPTRRWMR